MAVLPKNKPGAEIQHSAVQLFDELGDVFTRSISLHSPAAFAKELEKPLSILRGISQPEREAVQVALQTLWAELDKLSALATPDLVREDDVLIRLNVARLSPDATRRGNPIGTDDAIKALAEDAGVRAILESARQRAAAPMSTQASIRDGAAALTAMRSASAATLLDRIDNKELITSAELQQRLGIRRQSVSDAVRSGRLFAMLGPSGEHYYPAFYADPGLDRRAIEKVSKALDSLPAASKYFFFTTIIPTLQETPLQALAKGRLKEVLLAASAYAAGG